MDDTGDDSREQRQTRAWRSAAMLAGYLSLMVTISAALAAALPGSDAMRVLSGPLAVATATATGIRHRAGRAQLSRARHAAPPAPQR